MPVFDADDQDIIFYTAARGHHRDIGGLGGISGNPNCSYLEQEGAVIDSFKLVSRGVFDEDGNTPALLPPLNEGTILLTLCQGLERSSLTVQLNIQAVLAQTVFTRTFPT